MNADANSMMDDPNKMMTPEDIAKLLASLEADEAAETNSDSEAAGGEAVPVTGIDSVENADPSESEPSVAESSVSAEPSAVAEPSVAESSVSAEPSTGAEPSVAESSVSAESSTVAEPSATSTAMDMEDPNKMMTPEDIEKLLAAMSTEDGDHANEVDSNANSDGITDFDLDSMDPETSSSQEIKKEEPAANAAVSEEPVAGAETSVNAESSVSAETLAGAESSKGADTLAVAESLTGAELSTGAEPTPGEGPAEKAEPAQNETAAAVTELSASEKTDEKPAITASTTREEETEKPKKVYQKPTQRLDASVTTPISKETCILHKDIHIVGNISTNGNMEIYGNVEGDISVAGKLSIHGKIDGVAQANEIFIDNARFQGMLLATNTVKVGPSAVILGDITGKSAVIAGAIKGDIDVYGPVVIDSKAVIKGNIKSETVQINNGAIVDGNCVQCYGAKDAQSFFDKIEKEE